MTNEAKLRWFITVLLFSVALAQGQEFFPVKDVRPGLRGIGKTVFQGNRIEEFQVEILGVLDNLGPKQPIILARLSGGPLGETGVLQGMSGSPVYIDGKLLGAVALGFPFSKEPICGIQPIGSMIDGAAFGGSGSVDVPPARLGSLSSPFYALRQLLSFSTLKALTTDSPLGEMAEVLSPLSLQGFTSGTLSVFHGALERLGLSGMGVGGLSLSTALSTSKSVAANEQTSLAESPISPTHAMKAYDLQPGSMISVGLITGDWNMTADGTVTYVKGNRVYAFGHRFMGIGTADIPLAISDVIVCIPNTNSSFKISAPRQWIGTIVSDRATAIAGELGRLAHTIPIEIAVTSGATGSHSYHLQVVDDRLLTPFLTQAVLFSTLDSTERSIGAGTLKLQGQINFEGNLPPLMLHDVFVSDSGLTQQASADAVVELAFVLGGGFRDLHVKGMTFRLDQLERKKQVRLAQAWASVHDVRPGETFEITAILQGENGMEIAKTIPYRVPAGAAPGALNLTLSDANTLNFPEFAGIAQTQFQTAAKMIEAVSRYRDSESLYVRVWRQQPGFNVAGPMPGGELSDPPPSVALVLADQSASVSGGATVTARGSDVAQLSVSLNGYVVTGAKTIQVEVKE